MNKVVVKRLGEQDYETCWQNMKRFTNERNDLANKHLPNDELWLVEHKAVFTLGQAGKASHILNAHDIPVVDSDRGGQVTYHGPGQIVLYLLLNIEKLGLGSRALVSNIEQAIIDTLNLFNITAFAKKDAPGVYVNQQLSKNKLQQEFKIAALGLRIRKGCSYHGLSINFKMDLTPFSYINPCGYAGQLVTQVSDFNETATKDSFEQELIKQVCEHLKLSPVESFT